MRSAWKKLVRGLLPPLLVRAIERRVRGTRYTGDYADWAAARHDAGGYDEPAILARVAAAARLARDGRAAFERDGVAFADPQHAWPMLACLLRAAARDGGRLDVVDFGGSLGSAYFQHRALLRELAGVRWAVVEQPEFVTLGAREFANGELAFFPTLNAALEVSRPGVILFSGGLQYLPDPHATLVAALAAGAAAVVLDRTPLIPGARDRLTVQRNGPALGGASYPCWFLARERLLAPFAVGHACAAEWPALDPDADGAEFRGFCFERLPR